MIEALLAIIAIGVLLMSDAGRSLLNASYKLVSVATALVFTVVAGYFVFDFLKAHSEDIVSGLQIIVPICALAIGLSLISYKKDEEE